MGLKISLQKENLCSLNWLWEEASGFLVRLILENIPHPLPHPGCGGSLDLVAPSVILVQVLRTAPSFTVSKRLPHAPSYRKSGRAYDFHFSSKKTETYRGRK